VECAIDICEGLEQAHRGGVALWLCPLDAGRADRIVDNLAGFRNEYRVVLGAGLLAVLLSLVAAIRAARWWYVAVMCSLGTLGFFTYALSR